MVFFAFLFYLALLFLSTLSPVAAVALLSLSFLPTQKKWTRNALQSSFVGGLLGLALGIALTLLMHGPGWETLTTLSFAAWLYFGAAFSLFALISGSAHCYQILFPWRRFHPPAH